MGVTIKQIAGMAGVHRATVDKVLHNRPGVSDEVRKKIQGLLDEYHYEANPIGKALKMQDKEFRIAVLMLQVDALPHIWRGIQEKRADYSAFQLKVDYQMSPYSNVEDQKRQLKRCRDEKVSGVILNAINHPEITEEINLCQQAGIPVVTVNTDAKDSQRICFVGQDGYKAGQVAARFMGEFLSGRGKVAVITSGDDKYLSFPFGTREGGFRKVIQENYPKIQVLPSVYSQENPAVMKRETRRLLEAEPDLSGIFITCGCVPAACQVLRGYDRKDIRLICFESYPELLDLLLMGEITLALGSGLEQQGRDSLGILMEKLIYDRDPEEKQKYSLVEALVKESL